MTALRRGWHRLRSGQEGASLESSVVPGRASRVRCAPRRRMNSLRVAGLVSRPCAPSLVKDGARLGRLALQQWHSSCGMQTSAAISSTDPSVPSPDRSTDIVAKLRTEKVELACPVCFRPLTYSGFQGSNLLTFKESSLRCKDCEISYKNDRGIIDLVIPSERVALGSSFFQNPLIAFVYERGYRDLFGLASFPGFDVEADMAQTLLEPARGEVIMDLSCGPGGFTRRFLAKGEYATVIASDFSQAMLEQCRGFLESDESADLSMAIIPLAGGERDLPLPYLALNLIKVVLVRADAARLPFATASVAGVHAAAAIHCWPNILSSVAEISRVLRPGGIFVGSTFIIELPTFLDEPLLGFRQTIDQLQLPLNWLRETDLRATTEACGLVNWYSYRRGIYMLFAASKPM